MVSKTLQWLDAWLAQAEEVLAEQPYHPEPISEPGVAPEEQVQLCFDFSGEL